MLDLEPRFGLKQTDDSSPRGSEKKRIVHPPFLANYPDPLSWLFITNYVMRVFCLPTLSFPPPKPFLLTKLIEKFGNPHP